MLTRTPGLQRPLKNRMLSLPILSLHFTNMHCEEQLVSGGSGGGGVTCGSECHRWVSTPRVPFSHFDLGAHDGPLQSLLLLRIFLFHIEINESSSMCH